MQRQRLVLGVDGGGTKTVAWLARFHADSDPEIIGHSTAGSSNMRAVGWTAASENLNMAIEAAWTEASVDCCAVDSAVLALAGSALPEVQDRVATWAAERNLADRMQVIHDAKAVLYAGTDSGFGVALVAGTGSVAYGQNSELASAVSGGWGYWFGDEGSAYGLGQAALRASALAADERGPTTQLLQAIKDRLEIEDLREALAALSRLGDVRLGIAGLADLVTTAAEKQDDVACQIVAQTGRDLASLVESVVKQLSLGERFSLALAGGVICHSQVVRESFLRCLKEKQLTPANQQLVKAPVAGCIKMACDDLTLLG